jgi:hypothetical protein
MIQPSEKGLETDFLPAARCWHDRWQREDIHMPECEALPRCIFFNDQMKSMPAASELMKKDYCRSDHEKCARYFVLKTLDREAVPPDLYPSEKTRALELVKNH